MAIWSANLCRCFQGLRLKFRGAHAPSRAGCDALVATDFSLQTFANSRLRRKSAMARAPSPAREARALPGLLRALFDGHVVGKPVPLFPRIEITD